MSITIHDKLLGGITLLELPRYSDIRGYVQELWSVDALHSVGITDEFVQDNFSSSKHGALRGMHAQVGMGKLLQVLSGKIQLVELDIRPQSDTFSSHITITLSAATPLAVWIPPGFANGFCALENDTAVHYKCTRLYNPADEVRIHPLDETIGIAWQATAPILSRADATAQSWQHYCNMLAGPSTR